MSGFSGSTPYAVIGTKPFSRRRHYDMEERRQRILGNPKYVISVQESRTFTSLLIFQLPLDSYYNHYIC